MPKNVDLEDVVKRFPNVLTSYGAKNGFDTAENVALKVSITDLPDHTSDQ